MEIVRYLPQTMAAICAFYLLKSLIQAVLKKPNIVTPEDDFSRNCEWRLRVRPFEKGQLKAIFKLHDFEKENKAESDSKSSVCTNP